MQSVIQHLYIWLLEYFLGHFQLYFNIYLYGYL